MRNVRKTSIFDKKLLIKKFGTPDGHGVNAKVVDIDKIYLNMRNEQNPMTRFRPKCEKPRFLIKNQKLKLLIKKIWQFLRKIRFMQFSSILVP